MLKNHLIIIPSNQNRNEVCDFLQQTAKIFSQDNHVYILDYTTEISIKELCLKIIKKQPLNLIEKINNLTYLTPIYVFPFRKNNLSKKINKEFYFLLVQLTLGLSTKKKLIWMFFPELSHLLNMAIPNWKIVYDIIDIYSHHQFSKNKILLKQKTYILKKASYIFAISETLKEQFKKITNKKIFVVPQGFDISAFENKNSKKVVRLPNKKPIIGFIGQINQRLDFDLLNKLIENNKQLNFVFVGPHKKDDELFQKSKTKQLINKQNVILIGKQPRSMIPAIIKQFDIAIIPYDISLDFNKFCYPMKLFEYIYMEKPVISTQIEELKNKKFKNIVFTSSHVKEWQKIIDQLLKNKFITNRNLSINNSWKNKLETISKQIK